MSRFYITFLPLIHRYYLKSFNIAVGKDVIFSNFIKRQPKEYKIDLKTGGWLLVGQY